MLAVIICLVLAGAASAQTSARTTIPALSASQWRYDVQYFVNELAAHHRNPYHYTSKADFDRAVSALMGHIPAMKDYEVVVGLQHLAALVGDGHTFIQTSELYHRFPLEVFWFGDQLRVVRAAADYKKALGCRVIQIGSVPVGEVQSRLQQLIPQGENEWFVMNASAQLMTEVEPLAALGVVSGTGPADFIFEGDHGGRFKLTIDPASKVDTSSMLAADSLPLPWQHSEDPFWFTYPPESQTVYVDFRAYTDLDKHTKELWAFLGQHHADRLIVDMRWNGGGNYTKGREYLIYKLVFSAFNRNGHLFVITGRGTFSAGMTNVTDFRRETEAILVGEPTGARPNGYQENYWFTLPHSKLRASCAKLKYRFQPEADTPAVFPDVRIDPDWKLFEEGEDAAVQFVLKQH